MLFVVSLCTWLAGDWVLAASGSSWSGLVPHCSSQCLSRRPEAHSSSSLSVCLILWDRNVACISSASHCALFLSLFPFIILWLGFLFSFLWVCPILWVYGCVRVCVHTHLHGHTFCMFPFPSTLWNLGFCDLAWGFTCITVSRWCECWGLGATPIHSTALCLCHHNCPHICIPWADYKAVEMSGLLSRTMSNVCLYTLIIQDVESFWCKQVKYNCRFLRDKYLWPRCLRAYLCRLPSIPTEWT